jgi:Leucine-rich repeat (LRR) protein
LTSLDISDNGIALIKSVKKSEVPSWSGVAAIKNAIRDMRALTSLDISSNNISYKQERDLKRICVAGGIKLTVV